MVVVHQKLDMGVLGSNIVDIEKHSGWLILDGRRKSNCKRLSKSSLYSFCAPQIL